MANQNQNEQQHQTSEHQDQQPTEQQQTGGQAPEETDQVKESIQKAVSRNMGGKREDFLQKL